jgi:hypothetical protein
MFIFSAYDFRSVVYESDRKVSLSIVVVVVIIVVVSENIPVFTNSTVSYR